MATKAKVALAVVAIVAAGIVVAGWFVLQRGFSALDEPSAVEAFVARRLRSLAIPSEAKGAQNPVALTEEVLSEARAHFADHCAYCHANNGSGDTSIGKGLYPKSPDMRQSATQSLTDGELAYIIHHGIRLTGMPAFGTRGAGEPDADSWKLVHFIRHLPNISEAELEEMEKFNPKSPAELQQEQELERFLRGEDVIPTPHTH